MSYKDDIVPHHHTVQKKDRIKKNGFNPRVIWFSGLSGSGKSTLASSLEAHFHNEGFNTLYLMGRILEVD